MQSLQTMFSTIKPSKSILLSIFTSMSVLNLSLADENNSIKGTDDYASELRSWLKSSDKKTAISEATKSPVVSTSTTPSSQAVTAEEKVNEAIKSDHPKITPSIKQNEPLAIKWLRKAAERGNANAQNNLGIAYRDGKDIPKDYAEAVVWFGKAAAQSHAEAQNNLGVMYLEGKGVPQDYAEAFDLFKKAAAQDNAYAQLNLGMMYDEGWGTSEDKDKARNLFNPLANKGNAVAQFYLGKMYYENNSKDSAYNLFKQSAQQSYAPAQHMVGVMYLKGESNYVSQNYQEAFSWFSKAAEQGYAAAQYNLGMLYYAGNGTQQDYKTAFSWFSKAAEREEYADADAQNMLGVLYYTGKGVSQNYTQAIAWYRKAAAQNHPNGKSNFGWMLILQGDFAAAREELIAAQNMLPNDPITAARLGHVYLLLDDLASSYTWYEKTIALVTDDVKLDELLKDFDLLIAKGQQVESIQESKKWLEQEIRQKLTK